MNGYPVPLPPAASIADFAQAQARATQAALQGIGAFAGSATLEVISPFTASSTPTLLAAVDITSTKSGIFLVGFSMELTNASAVVLGLLIQYSAGITAGYAGGANTGVIGLARYSQGSLVTGGTGGSGPFTACATSFTAAVTTAYGPMTGGLFTTTPGARIGVTFLAATTASTSAISAAGASFYAIEI
jgi:hypothetical protein